MHPLGSLIVELETARRKLQKVFEVQSGTATSEGKRAEFSMNRNRLALCCARSRGGNPSIKPIVFFSVTVGPRK